MRWDDKKFQVTSHNIIASNDVRKYNLSKFMNGAVLSMSMREKSYTFSVIKLSLFSLKRERNVATEGKINDTKNEETKRKTIANWLFVIFFSLLFIKRHFTFQSIGDLFSASFPFIERKESVVKMCCNQISLLFVVNDHCKLFSLQLK